MAVKEQKKSKIKMHKRMKETPEIKGQKKEENRDLESGDNPEERSKGMSSSSASDEE
jgi:cell division protein FtsB